MISSTLNRGEGVGKYAKYAARTRTHVCFKGRVGCQPVRERMFALKHVLVASQYANACSPRGHKWATAGHRARCGPLWPACGPLWPLVAPLFSTGEPLKNFRVARCAGHRATGPPEIFQRFGFLVFFIFRPTVDGLEREEKV